MTALVVTTVDDGIRTLTLDSPHNRNALSRQLIAELRDGLLAAEADAATRVVLIDHTGTVFCSGADLSEAGSADGYQGPQSMVELQKTIIALDKPVVVRVGGAARAGGIGIVAAADIAVAAADASFALTEVRLGLAPAVISPAILARMAPRHAQYTFLTAETFDGRQAAEYGLVTRAVPSADLDDEVHRVCRLLASGDLQGLRETKRLLSTALAVQLARDSDQLVELSVRLFSSDEAKAAMARFLDGRRQRASATPTR